MGYNGPKIFHTKRDYVRGGIKRLQNTIEGGIAPPSYAIPSEFLRISSTTFSIRLAVERLFLNFQPASFSSLLYLLKWIRQNLFPHNVPNNNNLSIYKTQIDYEEIILLHHVSHVHLYVPNCFQAL